MDRSCARAFAMAHAIVETLLHDSDRGMILSIDIGDSLFDVVAANVAEQNGCDFQRSPSLLRYLSYTRGMGPPLLAANDGLELPVFARIDGNLEVSTAFEPLEIRVKPVATRSIDRWTSARPPLRLLHLGDADLLPDQIAGAVASISHHRPVLTMYPAGQDRLAILSALKSLNYEIFNLEGNSANPAGEAESEFGWIAVPAAMASIVETVRRQMAAIVADDHSAWQLEASRAAFPRQRRLPDIFGLDGTPPPPRERKIDARDMIFVDGCYPLESEKSHSWRWLGPRPLTRVALPCPLPGAYMLEIAVLGTHLERGLADCRVLVEGREMKTSFSDSLPGSITFAGHVSAAAYKGSMELVVVNTGRVESAGNDQRTLRLSVESITMSHWQ